MLSRLLPALIAAAVLAAALPVRADTQLNLTTLGTATQSGPANPPNPAAQAIDGSLGTFSETADVTNSFWEIELGRKVHISAIDLIPPYNVDGVVLTISDLRDSILFRAVVTGTTANGTWTTNLPSPVDGRIVRFALGSQTNGSGNFKVAISEMHIVGDASPAYGALSLGGIANVAQTSTNATLDPTRTIDGNSFTTSETLDLTNGYFILTFDRVRPIQRIQLLNTTNVANAARMQGLTLRILDNSSNSIASTAVSNPGASNAFVFTPPPGTSGRYVKVGLEGGATNGFGDRVVSLAEVSLFSTTNLAVGKDSYMTRVSDTLPPNSNANDGDYSTEIATQFTTHDAYWEVNLGKPSALYSVRVVSSTGLQADMQHVTLNILDGAYNLVYTQHLAGVTEIFDVPLPGPVVAQYVRVSLDYAERSRSGSSWFIGMKEVEVYGRLTNEVGVISLTATQTQIVSGASTTLQWQEQDLFQLKLFPNIGSVGSNTSASGLGTRLVTLTNSTEYTLVGTDFADSYTRALAIEVNGQKLPARIGEFVADNNQSLKDGNKNASDWIELHNPNNTTLDLSGYYLSDDPAALTKWKVPPGTTIAPHGQLIIFADSASTNQTVDPAGYLHANFGLGTGGESLILTSTNGATVVDGVTNFPAQMQDLAYGRTLDGQWKFLEPTPGTANAATSYDGWLAEPDFDHKRGWYTNAFSLAISNSNPGSVLYFSTDGTEPTNVYTGPLAISTLTGVRASVARAGYKSPSTKTHTYLFLESMVNAPEISATYRGPTYTNQLRQAFLDLPIVSINVPPPDPKWQFLSYNNARPERAGSLEIFMPDGSDVQENCSIVHYGGQFGTGTGLYGQKTWQVQFKSQYGTTKLNLPFFQGFGHGITPQNSFKEIDLHGGNQDQAAYSGGRGFGMSQRFAADTMLEMGDVNPHGRFVHLFMNGVYMGQFDAHERLTDAFLADYLGGSKEDYLTVKGNDNTGVFGFIPGIPDPPDRAAWETVRSNRFSYAAIRNSVDMTNYIDFMLLWEWGNGESEYRGAMARQPSTGGSLGFKLWVSDADGLLRQQSGASGQLSKNNVTTSVFTNGPGYIFGALLNEGHPDFKSLLADRIFKHCFNGGALTPQATLARLNLRMTEITNSLVAECARWGTNFNLTYDPVHWQADAQYARDNILPVRTATLFSQMRSAGWYPSIDPPPLSQYGGSVSNGYVLTVSSGSGAIYYTLDGSDPRLPGGGISPTAHIWTNTQTINTVVSVPLSSTWRYFNTNVAPAGNWQSNGYNDSTWLSGNTPMGYPAGDGGEVFGVVLNFGTDSNNKWLSYYFRKTFSVTNLTGLTGLSLGLNRDDGAVVYLNGSELMRDNMPAGPVTFTNLATTAVSGSNETNVFQFSVPSSLLTTGTNTVAVEVHQDAGNSTDIHFNLSLKGTVTNTVSALTLVLTNDTIFTARVWNGTTWSALEQTTFILAALRQPAVGDLVISELNYHPPDLDDYEFVELYNASTNQLDLTGVRLADGIDFAFPNGFRVTPGGFALAVRNSAAFDQRYRTPASPYYYANIPVAGQYSGKLSDSGEHISLLASNGLMLAEVTYQDGGAWPGRADGNGSSLELRDALAAVANPTNLNAHLARGLNWRSSSIYFGSPGRFDTDRKVVINELFAHSHLAEDWVELKNVTSSPVDLSSYFLSDSYNQPFHYDFPAGTIIPAGGFMVLNETNLGFGFSELGEDVILTEVSGTNIVRFADTAGFPAIARFEALGRYTRSDGIVDFTELRTNTPAADNALPRIGPLVFSEIMYHPTNGNVEFLELVNLAVTNVPLYDPAHTTNTWHLAGAVTFTFPTGETIPPGGVILLSATNPATFRTQYGVSPSIPVYGPWTGALDNAGEEVRIEHPGDPETNGFVPYYRIDHVRYEAVAPWPLEANGGGSALERLTLEGYGNDPANWRASAIGGTPGTFTGNRAPATTTSGVTTVMEGDTVSLTVEGTDPDLPWQSVTLNATNLPSGSSFNPSTGQFSWTTSEPDGPGVYSIKFIATDNGVHFLSATQTVAVTVLESNRAPSLQSIANLQYPALTPLVIDLTATDPDLPAQSLSFGASGLPAGITINPGTGRISGSAQAQGVYPIHLTVSDNQSPPLIATNAFTLTVTEAFKIQASYSIGTGRPHFSFFTIAGETYDIYFSTDLGPANWQLLQNIASAPGGLVTVPDLPNPSAPHCFVRVLWSRH